MAAADGRFNRIRQVAPMCPHGRIHWRHLVNTIELVLPSAHTSPQLKRQIDRFGRFCTARGRKSLYFTVGTPFPQNCPFPRISGPHHIHDSFSQTEPTVQRHLIRFSCFRTADRRVSLYFTMGASFPKNCPFARGI